MPNHSTYEENGLLLKLAEGDGEAMLLIFKKYYSRLCYFSMSLLENKEDARDIVNNVFARCWEQHRTLVNSGINNLEAYLTTMVRNACLDYFRHQKIAGRVEKQLSAADTEDLIEARLIQSDLINRLYLEIKNLPPQCSKIAELIFIRGWTPGEIALNLNIAASTVRTQQARAIELLRTGLLKKGLNMQQLAGLLLARHLFEN